MGRITAFTGAHGTGKTTAVYMAAAEHKVREAGDIRIITEVARRCPYPVLRAGNLEINPMAQWWIFNQQMAAELDAMADESVSAILSDRTVVDNLAYSILGDLPAADTMYELIESYIGDVDPYREIYLRPPNPLYLKCDSFRDTDAVLQQRIHDILVELYEDFGVVVSAWV